MKRKEKKSCRILISLLLMIPMLLTMGGLSDARVFAADSTHYLAFASDYRSADGKLDGIENFLKGMPAETEYVGFIGDMAGEKKDDKPAYETSPLIFNLQKVFQKMSSENVSVLWADHDDGVNDSGGLVKGKDGTSGQLFEGKKSDGSAAYYVYGIGFNDMTEGGERSKTAASAFKTWADGNDQTAPVIVLCHVPIQSMRGDNKGATYWNEALNYVATRTEGITTADKTGTVRRNVVFLCGHNFTCDTKEYCFKAGEKMNVQIDDSAVSAQSAGEQKAELQDDAARAEEAALQEGASDVVYTTADDTELLTKVEAAGLPSNIYYTSLTAGYLSTTGNATLMTITDKEITLNKYNNGSKATSIGTSGAIGTAMGDSVVIQKVVTKTQVAHSSITVTKTDASGNTLTGAEFSLLDADNKQITTYSGGGFAISTNDAIFASRLPAVGASLEMTLKETKAPTGYKLPTTTNKIVISAAEEEKMENGERISTTRYSITIDGNTSAKIVNTKQSAGSSSTSGGSSAGKSTSSSSAVGNVPKTGDPLHPGVYAAAAVLAGLALAGIAVRKRRRDS